MITVDPGAPLAGAKLEMVGAAPVFGKMVRVCVLVVIPPGATTVIDPEVALPGKKLMVICVGESTWNANEPTETSPMNTLVAPVKFVP